MDHQPVTAAGAVPCPGQAIVCSACSLFQLSTLIGAASPQTRPFNRIVKSPRTLKRGEMLYAPGEPCRHVYAVRSGSFKTFLPRGRDGVCITGFHLPGEMLGLEAVDDGVHRCGARALETASVCELSLKRLEEFGKLENRIQQQMLRLMSRQIRHNLALHAMLSGTRAEQRLAAFIANLSARFQRRGFSAVEFRVSMSRRDIANYLGLTKETVCRTLVRFQQQGYLDMNRRHLRIRDFPALIELAAMPADCGSRD